MKCLFIDDDKHWLSSLEGAFSPEHTVILAECHDVEEALQAVEKHKPEMVFFDHQLTSGGWEGFQIARKIKHLKLFSISSDENLKRNYEAQGVVFVGKRLKELWAILGKG